MKLERLAIVAVCFCSMLLRPSNADDRPLIFESDIRPVLAKKCGKCHREDVRKGGLDLSSMASVRRGGESGEGAVAESVDESLLWIMIDGGDMPPEGQPRLTDKERELIRKWIATGARSDKPLPSAEKELNQHDVLPIVLLRCTTCHGARIKRGGVDLRTPELMRKGGEHGPALVPGVPDASLMIQRIESEACPPRELLLKFFVKRPPVSEVKVLRDWIAAGAPVKNIEPDVATTKPDPLVVDEDRQHWAFQPPQVLPGEHSLDGFILEKLTEQGLPFSPEADRDTLIRRVYFDLIGMPPSLAEWKRWRGSNDEDWYARMVDDLLASPRYGERWARHWLDLAGYADSEGGTSADPVRKVAWKYRDYVIRSFNNDKPYDRFLIEQIAGDELIDHANAPAITEEMVDNLIATGFLRMGIDQTGSRTMNFVPERIGVISDAITVLGEGLMGLTMGCARCHSHKYDPIPHRDYYRFKAIFQGAFDEHDWLTFKNRTLNVDVEERRKRVAQVNPPLLASGKKLQARLNAAANEIRLELLRQHYPEQSDADRKETLRALRIADNNRSQPQRILVEKLQQVEVLPDSDQPEPVVKARRVVAEIENELAQVRRKMEPPLTIRAVWDRGEPSPTYILRRGEHNKPGALVGPGVPSVLTDGQTPFAVEPPFPGGTAKTGRRLAFARWLTQPNHPLTARVMVNRIWYHHFGTGLVKSLENFGAKGDRPSHPMLLDWLAVEFVKQGWSVKHLHRAILNSRTYRQSSDISQQVRHIDPQNRLLSHMTLRRMDAEALRDSLLFVSGKLDNTPGGPPDAVSVNRDGLVSVTATPDGRWRRSIYLQYRRTEIPSMMATFDYPEMGPNCLSRSVSTVSPQSLMLMNNQHVRDLAADFAARVEELTKESKSSRLEDRVITVYQLALSRSPSEAEQHIGVDTLKELRAAWQETPDAALQTYCHTILNSAAFLYVD
ncbi:MAG: PSD1 and planctomycete cytochrome C domain-containing protein [Planctomycetota bacterium]|nr:PSD1 and planctomycete cytochrome C domain-containing protein [Planctomycetota bacterium]MDA1251691.1 PSD1 and planctomycete cytochrome C domain-containing protein [Planctomycetota bacterium]